ncbi:MAG: rhomboid family intramembrane serine protease [Myxococcales bacterium]|nr:rhomboid family intramembrane serine protease [Myxococcales bacterium]
MNVAVFALVSLPLMFDPVSPGAAAAAEYHRILGARPETAYDLFVFEHGFKPGAFGLTDLFASMFLHGGFAHLAGNMLFLWIYGDNVEHYLGRIRYLFAYLGTGIIATLTFGAFASDSLIPMVGASGAISGVLGLYFVLFPRNRVKVFVFLFPFIMNIFLIPARIVLGIYLVLENLFPALLGAGGGVAYGAHIGGFVGGLGAAWLIERTGFLVRRGPRAVPKSEERDGATASASRSSDAFDLLRDALQEGLATKAVAAVRDVNPRDLRRLPPHETAFLARSLNGAGHTSLATQLLRQAIADHQTDRGSLAELYLALGTLRLENGQATAAYQSFMNVLDLAPRSPAADQAWEALNRIAGVQAR